MASNLKRTRDESESESDEIQRPNKFTMVADESNLQPANTDGHDTVSRAVVRTSPISIPSTPLGLPVVTLPPRTLFDLPTEIFVKILSYLGPRYFRKNTHRFTISKQWFELAYGFTFWHLEIMTWELMELVQCEGALERLRQTAIASVDVYLEYPGLHRRPAEIHAMESRIATVASAVRQFRQLVNLRIRDDGSYFSGFFTTDRKLTASTKWASGIFSLPFLDPGMMITNLHLDVVGDAPVGDAPVLNGNEKDTDCHFCCAISALLGSLPALRRFHCRLSYLCKCLLDLPASKDNMPLALEEVVIGLCYVNQSPSNMFNSLPKLIHSQGCRLSGYGERDSAKLIRDMEDQATALAGRLRKLRVFEVVSWADSSIYPVKRGSVAWAFDALTQKRHVWTWSYDDWSWNDPSGRSKLPDMEWLSQTIVNRRCALAAAMAEW
ncbi:hypothetical protein B0T24DRAFT_692610 [Lasiosphaeria ovina]|uniref:F-box domain-containing protein n=1 Tax=Lasiosphaeria ovina TaxID=92902 RepID=A0AAE0MXW4_9PEZI|nr:hypothetical protein B0T24DRAFT_692610 [Lasiosphaeria ovina]